MTNTTERQLNPDPFLTVAECAKYLNLSDPTVRRAIASGDLPSRRFGTAVRVRLSHLIRYADNGQPS